MTLRQEIAEIVRESTVCGKGKKPHLCWLCTRELKENTNRICEAVMKMAEGMNQYKIANPNPFRDSPQKKARNNAVNECQAYLKEQVK